MARVYVQLARFGGMSLGEGMREARRAAQQALEIDPNLAIGHVALGWVQRTADWDWRGALRSFNRARELAPDDCAIMGDAAVLLLNIGQIDEAVRLARAGAARDPLNARAQASLGYVLALAGRSEEALPPIRRAIELAPAIDEAHSHLARALLRLGRIDEAEQAANLEPHDAYRWNVQSLILAKRGRTAESERVFNQFQAKYRDEMPGYIAVSLAMRGQTDQAFEWIERAIALRDSSIPWFKTNSYLESLRSDPRWDKFLHRLGLADEQLK
jgi:tetratricopeptide (TPR) repeat protein